MLVFGVIPATTRREIPGASAEPYGERLLERPKQHLRGFAVERRPAIINVMGSSQRESIEQWSERAIVANSAAAAHEESLAEAGNPVAKRVARRRAEEAAADLQQALTALQTQRRQG